MRLVRRSVLTVLIWLLAACGGDDSTGLGPMILTVERTSWVLGVQSTFRARIENWDNSTSMRVRAVFCPDIVVASWQVNVSCVGRLVIADETQSTESLTRSFDWDGCGGSLFFSVTLGLDEPRGAVAAC